MKQLSRIQEDALTGLNTWSEEDFAAVKAAAGTVYKASVLARQQGLLALEEFVTKSEFFNWSLSMIVDGTDPEYLEELIENRYFTTPLHGIEKCIFYIYARGSLLLQCGITNQLIREFFVSVVPESYRDEMRVFIAHCKEEMTAGDSRKTQERAAQIFKNQDMSVLSPEEREIKTQFDTIIQSMPDGSIQRVLLETEQNIFELALLYADEATRECIIHNISDRLYQSIVEDWQHILPDHKQSIKSMRTILTICEKLQDCGEIFIII